MGEEWFNLQPEGKPQDPDRGGFDPLVGPKSQVAPLWPLPS